MGSEERRNIEECSYISVFSSLVISGVEKIVDQDFNPAKAGDASSLNTKLFIRDMMVYLKLHSAIKASDIGRLEKVLEFVALIFQAGSTPKYAQELMHFRCCMRHVWDEDIRTAVLSSMMVNTSGRQDGWVATDLYQEHNNRAIKHVYRGRQGDTTFDLLRERVSMNIETFRNVKSTNGKTITSTKEQTQTCGSVSGNGCRTNFGGAFRKRHPCSGS
ncbi:hypothetical protein EDD21DRAFT_311290 [Dissophora ornata]|nr:hypothetical protein EDD21DRAFT_311290 [Dissophora ornata]